LRDAVITILSGKPVDKLDSPEDREFIKDEIRFAVNKMLHRGEVLQVYFSEFIIHIVILKTEPIASSRTVLRYRTLPGSISFFPRGSSVGKAIKATR
jgi:hypothetical protein